MKICYLAGAESIHTQRWVKYFADNGHDVHLISIRSFGEAIQQFKIGRKRKVNSALNPKRRESYNIENVELHLLKRLLPQIRSISSPANLFFEVIRVRKLIKKINPDIVHAHDITDYGVIGAFAGFYPFVMSPWGSDILIDPKKSKIIKLTVKFVLNKADLIISDGWNTIDTMLGFGINPQKIKLIFNGVDTKKFKPVKKDEKIIKNLSIFNSPIVISLRSLRPIYDIGTFIKSIPMILKKIANAKFIIAGEGSEEEYLKGLAKSLGILDSIRFVGWIPHEKLPKYLSASDVYVSTSLSDGGISISTLEAMACELAPVVTDVANNKKWIKDGENGFIVPTKDPKSLAEKIIYLLENENVRMEFGKINRKIVEEKQDYYKEMEKMEKLYKELIKNNDKAKGGKYANTCSKDILP